MTVLHCTYRTHTGHRVPVELDGETLMHALLALPSRVRDTLRLHPHDKRPPAPQVGPWPVHLTLEHNHDISV